MYNIEHYIELFCLTILVACLNMFTYYFILLFHIYIIVQICYHFKVLQVYCNIFCTNLGKPTAMCNSEAQCLFVRTNFIFVFSFQSFIKCFPGSSCLHSTHNYTNRSCDNEVDCTLQLHTVVSETSP